MRLCACALAALLLVQARAAPAHDTLVVAASTAPAVPAAAAVATAATSNPAVPPVTPAFASTNTTADTKPGHEGGPATEQPSQPLKMTSMEVTSEVALRYAHTSVLTRVRNPATHAQEATFSLILPDTAFVSGFVMTLNGTSYTAYVKEKEEAKAVYENALTQGLAAAHVSAKARDSNHFTVRVNVEPQTEAVFNLTYEELLERRDGVYQHAVTLHPGRPVPSLRVTIHIREGKRVTVLRVPPLRTGNEIDATDEDAQNPDALVVRSADGKEATVTFSPDLAQQQRLMEIYNQKTRESRLHSAPHSYRRYSVGEEEAPPEGVLGQFVVQYDVEHGTDGEVFLNDGYFVHFFSPPQLPALNKHVVFVLDTSGSMMSRKIEQLRDAMTSILSELNPGDYFNIVQFASSTHVYRLEEALQEPRPAFEDFYSYAQMEHSITLVPPARATPENIALARTIVGRLKAAGGTNINEALLTAIELVTKGVGWQAGSGNTSSGAVASSSTTSATTVAAAAAAAVAQHNTTGVVGGAGTARPEPIIIFLTDGDPTVGEMDPRRIVRRVSELNTGDKRAAIFSLAFGEDADRGFLRKLSLRNEGFLRHIYEAADAAQQLRHFYRQVSSPLLADVRFVYPPGQIEESSVTKRRFHTLYAGAEVVVAGRVAGRGGGGGGKPQALAPLVHGRCGVVDHQEKVFTSERGETAVGPLERLWAYITIKQKLDERDAAAADAPDAGPDAAPGRAGSAPEKEALRLALKYSFVTPLTSLVVVKPNATSAVDAESVDNAPTRPYPYPSAFSSSGGASLGYVAYPSALFAPAPPLPALSGGPSGAALEEEEEEIDGHFSYMTLSLSPSPPSPPSPQPPPQSPPQSPPTTPRPASPAPADDALDAYGLSGFEWTQPLLNATAALLTLDVNGTRVQLRLARPINESVTTEATVACARATDGGAGLCTYLPRCEAARNITAQLYRAVYCVHAGLAGVCCPTPTLSSTPTQKPTQTPTSPSSARKA